MQSVIKRSVIVDRQTARQKKHTDSLTDIDTDKQRQTDTETDRQKNRKTER